MKMSKVMWAVACTVMIAVSIVACQKTYIPDSAKKTQDGQRELFDSDYEVVITSNKSTKASEDFTFDMTEDNMTFTAKVYYSPDKNTSVPVSSDSVTFYWGSTDLSVLYPEEGNGDTMTYHFGPKAGTAAVTLSVDILGVTTDTPAGKKTVSCDASVEKEISVKDSRELTVSEDDGCELDVAEGNSVKAVIEANYSGYAVLRFNDVPEGFQYATAYHSGTASEWKDCVDTLRFPISKTSSVYTGYPVAFRYTGTDYNFTCNITVSLDGQESVGTIIPIRVKNSNYGVVHDLDLSSQGYCYIFNEENDWNYTGMRKYLVGCPTGKGTWSWTKKASDDSHYSEEVGDDYIKVTVNAKNTGFDPVTATYVFTDADGKEFATLNCTQERESGVWGIKNNYDSGKYNEQEERSIEPYSVKGYTYFLSCPTGEGTWTWRKVSDNPDHFSESCSPSSFTCTPNKFGLEGQTVSVTYNFLDSENRVFATLIVEHYGY